MVQGFELIRTRDALFGHKATISGLVTQSATPLEGKLEAAHVTR
jgi:hypothetical protein